MSTTYRIPADQHSKDPSVHAARGKHSMQESRYEDAVGHYTRAIQLAPEAVDYYIQRSVSYQRVGKYKEALSDAERGVFLAHKRGKREFIAAAQLRRGISLQTLQQWGDSRFCLGIAKRLNDKDKSIDIWLNKCDAELGKLDENDPKREVTVQEIPDVVIEKTAPEEKPKAKEVTVQEKPKVEGVQTPADKIRHEWFQTNTHVDFTLYVKGVPKDKAQIQIEESSISITFPMPNGSDYTFDLDPLFSEIDPSASKFTIMGTKIELKLVKKKPGLKWTHLEKQEVDKGKAPEAVAPEPTPQAKPTSPSTTASAPAYPTSSKSGPKNWDKVASELTGKPPGADDDFDDEEGDPVNNLFKKIYAGADEDTKRAMMKSYIESNGTMLSTNWQEVSKGKMETTPPEGMEAKSWN